MGPSTCCVLRGELCCLQSTLRSSPATWVDLFATLGTLRNLEYLSITADNAFNGTLLPDMLSPGQATICSLARAKLGYLKISDVDGQADYVMHSLNGTLPACLFDSRSQIRTISIGMLLPSAHLEAKHQTTATL